MEKKFKVGLSACLCLFILDGCATRDGMEELELTGSQNQKILRENEMRLSSLENSVNELNTQIAQLNNRVYEVRTRNGQKTAMTVVPVGANPSRSVAAPSTASHAPQATASPVGKRINPASKPAPLPVSSQRKPAAPATAKVAPPVAAQPSGSLGQPERSAGPSGSLAQGADDLAMPPTEIETPVPASHTYSGTTISGHAETGIRNAAENVVPVPLIPSSDLSLPPEQSTAAPAPGTEAPVSAVPAPTPPPAPAATPRTAAGEEAAYQAALKAARSGNTNEGIRLFRDFLQKYPNGRYTANADYWLGECLYAQGKYKDALNQFQTVNTSYPTHHKNADALLKAGLTMNRMGDKTGAQTKFKQVLASFPNSDAARRVRAMGIR